ncbi:MAG TPA: serine--tRNA ligase [Candidatus Omnitrophica bacterium]|nr:MAG: serine--tRNA ligase [Omnitrophica WOR_2 bacterium GWA2_63_20]OGX16173.1 MAG: serine--tRNA ligase [Omnitrophica WOR_2 bacterium GWF2_63_9]OGX32101.1 MAG: serine--tRNA ligase [Omnitrophica WOR_2 bacterium RIFCSPHIGHO2_12_FULL_64_13]OGX35152.1 MAG: serine--tRNA ligase [Omnitrophica WOR_2 bacterium RIFCSPHIGHO2_02_FULL_63_39]OGX45564.1 MAG: serine--tRNA ligase [Omnitrophica WOR_2 bacterium RIFCSPLOWO2_02_FULL_63_16]OGX48446.1 MAG: serine--tRNA ligase [Omnitrophica WOR_2 bacterium RIFCSPLOW
MLDLRLLREQPEVIREAIRRRGLTLSLDALLELEQTRRTLIGTIEGARQALKRGSEEFARQKTKGLAAPPATLKQLSDQIAQDEQQLRAVEEEIVSKLSYVPNIPHESVPSGDASHNQVVRTHGTPSTFSFSPKTHMELGAALGLLDLERAAKIAGSHFPLFIDRGARLVRVLIQWMLDVQTKEHGYTEVWPPALVNRASMFGTGQLPKFEEDMYRLKDDDLFLIPTAEVPVTNLHRDDILEEERLPLKYTAYTPCFRREAGSYGKDTKGLIRVHQFDKVELVKLATPETSYEEHERLVRDAEVILQRLGLHYRVVCLASGDLGFAAAKCYDLEAWAPGLAQYLEVSSCSNFEAFQARRASIRYRQRGSKKLAYVHTLNGSGVALARTLIVLLETHQQADGHIRIPEPLRPYLDGQNQI